MLRFVSVFDSPKFKVRKREIHKLLKFLSEDLGFKILSLDLYFVDSDRMREINKRFLDHDYDTDIVTLDYSRNPELIESDIFISHQTAEKNAEKFGVTLNNEIIRLIIHGVLHLTGYDDTTPNEKRKMKKKENELTKKYSDFELLK